MVDAHQMQHRCIEVMNVNRIFHVVVTKIIELSPVQVGDAVELGVAARLANAGRIRQVKHRILT